MSSTAMAWNVTPRDGGQFWGQRMALASAEDIVRGLYLQSVLKAIRALGDEALVTRCTASCGQARFFDFFNYPVRLQLQMMSLVMPALTARHEEAERALWLMGHCVAMDFLESEAGRTVQVLVRGEPKRLVNHLPLTYRMSVTGERSVKWTGPQCCRFTMKRDFMPSSFHEGLLVAMLERLGASKVKVLGRQTDVLESEYDISWQ
ncbi:MAG: TIGR02265 family protein [Archangium sp.]